MGDEIKEVKCLACSAPLSISENWRETVSNWLDELETHMKSPLWDETSPPEAIPCSSCSRAYCRGCVKNLLWCDLGALKRKFGSAEIAKIQDQMETSPFDVFVD